MGALGSGAIGGGESGGEGLGGLKGGGGEGGKGEGIAGGVPGGAGAGSEGGRGLGGWLGGLGREGGAGGGGGAIGGAGGEGGAGGGGAAGGAGGDGKAAAQQPAHELGQKASWSQVAVVLSWPQVKTPPHTTSQADAEARAEKNRRSAPKRKEEPDTGRFSPGIVAGQQLPTALFHFAGGLFLIESF